MIKFMLPSFSVCPHVTLLILSLHQKVNSALRKPCMTILYIMGRLGVNNIVKHLCDKILFNESLFIYLAAKLTGIS